MDRLFAEQHGLATGDRLPILGHPLRVVGLTGQTVMFMTPLVFSTEQAMNEMLRAGDTTGSVLVTTGGDPAAVNDRLRERGLNVRTHEQP